MGWEGDGANSANCWLAAIKTSHRQVGWAARPEEVGGLEEGPRDGTAPGGNAQSGPARIQKGPAGLACHAPPPCSELRQEVAPLRQVAAALMTQFQRQEQAALNPAPLPVPVPPPAPAASIPVAQPAHSAPLRPVPVDHTQLPPVVLPAQSRTETTGRHGSEWGGPRAAIQPPPVPPPVPPMAPQMAAYPVPVPGAAYGFHMTLHLPKEPFQAMRSAPPWLTPDAAHEPQGQLFYVSHTITHLVLHPGQRQFRHLPLVKQAQKRRVSDQTRQ